MSIYFSESSYTGSGVYFGDDDSLLLPNLPVHPEAFEFVELPIWFNRGNAFLLGRVFDSWWKKVKSWLLLPLQNLDPETCPRGVLDVIAWGRNIDLFPGEPEALYRKRVKYAFVNAVDAGSVAGIKRIFQRLGVGYVNVRERVDGYDWDVIILELSDAQLGSNTALLSLILQKYGRTCRRYEFSSISTVQLGLGVAEFGHQWEVDSVE